MITHLFCNGPLYHNPKFRVAFRVAQQFKIVNFMHYFKNYAYTQIRKNCVITGLPQIRSFFYTADDGNRTRDLLTTNEVRYRLCHISKLSPLRLFILPQVLRFVKHIFQFFYFFERGRFQTPLAQNQIPHLSKSMSRYTIAIQ